MQATAAALNYPAKKSLYVNKALKTPLYSHKGSFLRPEGWEPHDTEERRNPHPGRT